MEVDRRRIVGQIGLAALLAGVPGPTPAVAAAARETALVPALDPQSTRDQSGPIREAIAAAAGQGRPVLLPPGRFVVRGGLQLVAGSTLVGAHGRTYLVLEGDGPLIEAENADGLVIEGIALEAGGGPMGRNGGEGLLTLRGGSDVRLTGLTVSGSGRHGLALERVSGRVSGCRILDSAETGLFSLDARGLDISHNEIARSGNNGIQVWRSAQGEDGTTVTLNRIHSIGARNGGTGENGNGINVFRAGSVLVSGNRITDCAFSAIRANSASDCQMLGNSCERLGEVALYAEFAFEGVVISGNLVDRAAQGISVTNFNEGGRLAVVSGNLVRNLFTHASQEDPRGIGISVEADAMVSGNVVESAPAVGIMVGWHEWKRDCALTGNLVRKCAVGIGLSAALEGGLVFVSQNMIAGAVNGAIRAMEGNEPVGPDLARASAESFPNLAILANVAS
ncbi:MAG: TIGR03808 family TAT-translocated repetitive protein [Hyphomicrobiaceae bacterium]